MFCNGPLWNSTLTWEIDIPDLTHCFQTSILPLIPLCALLGLSSYDISIYVSHRKKKINKIGYNWYNISKQAIITTLCVVNIIKLCYFAKVDSGSAVRVVYPSNYFYEIVFLICHIISFVLLITSLRYGLRRSFAQFLFYLLSVVCEIIVLRSCIITIPRSEPLIIFNSVHLALNFKMFVLTGLIDYAAGSLDKGNVKNENLCPLISANLPSKLSFAWVTPLIWKGLKETLKPSMLWNLHPKITCKVATSKFEKFYKRNEFSKWNILVALFRAFGREFGLASIIQIFVVGVSTVSPRYP